jgi:hypothetical protein
MDEKRKSTRHRILKAGKIAFGGGIVDCTVRNPSETGAALESFSLQRTGPFNDVLVRLAST